VSFLADTNILGELTRPRPNRGVVVWANQVAALNLSVITLEEIHHGLAWRPNERIRAWFEKFLTEQCRVLPVTDDIARQAGDLRGRFRLKGETRSQADMLIAATALTHGLTLVTRNEDDFGGCGMTILNPLR
jgi:predicted nucleic acid-binding protein